MNKLKMTEDMKDMGTRIQALIDEYGRSEPGMFIAALNAAAIKVALATNLSVDQFTAISDANVKFYEKKYGKA